MRLTAIESIRPGAFLHPLWGQGETDERLTGLGEEFSGSAAIEAHIHAFIAACLPGQNPLPIDRQPCTSRRMRRTH